MKEKILKIIKSNILKLSIKYSYFILILVLLVFKIKKLYEIEQKLFFIFQYIYNIYVMLVKTLTSTISI